MITTHTHRIPTFLISEAPDGQNDGGWKNILKKYHYLLILFLKDFPREPFLVSVEERRALDSPRITNFYESTLQ